MSTEKKINAPSGWAMLLVTIALYLVSPVILVWGIMAAERSSGLGVLLIILYCVVLTVAIIFSCGFFTLQPGQKTTKEITLRPLVSRPMVSGAAISPSLTLASGTSLSAFAAGGKCILAFLGPHREPAKHLVKEIVQQEQDFRSWGGNLFITTTDPANPDLKQLPNATVTPLASGQQHPVEKAVAQALKLDTYEYPLVAVLDSKGSILFYSHGYSIGLAEQLLACCRQ